MKICYYDLIEIKPDNSKIHLNFYKSLHSAKCYINNLNIKKNKQMNIRFAICPVYKEYSAPIKYLYNSISNKWERLY